REVERGGGVGLDDFHHLGRILAGALAGVGKHGLDGRVVGLGNVLEAGIVVAGLRNALFGESADLLGNLERDDGSREWVGRSHGMHSFAWGVNVERVVTPCAPRETSGETSTRITGTEMPLWG